MANRGADIEIPLAAARLGPNLTVVEANTAWHAATEGSPTANGHARWEAILHVTDADRVTSRLRRVIDTGTAATFEARGATTEWIEIHATPNTSARGPGLVLVAVDISAHKRREETLAYAATHDPLTGLHNRVALLDRTQDALRRLARHEGLVAVLFIDLDHFKEVNDRFGHGVGDKVLSSVAARLQRGVRPSDILGRIGGDEFVVICEGLTSPVEASPVARRLVDAVRQAHEVDSRPVDLSVSIGIAFAASADDDPAALIGAADRAMYVAKERGEPVYAGPPVEGMPLAATASGLGSAELSLTGAIELLQDAELAVSRHGTLIATSDGGENARARVATRHIRRAIAMLRNTSHR